MRKFLPTAAFAQNRVYGKSLAIFSLLILLFSSGEIQAQCSTKGTQVGSPASFDASTLVLGVNTQTHAGIVSGEWQQITNLTAGCTYNFAACGVSINSHVTVFTGGTSTVEVGNDAGCGGGNGGGGAVDFTPSAGGIYDFQINTAGGCGTGGDAVAITMKLVTAGCAAPTFSSQPGNATACPAIGSATFTAATAISTDSLRWFCSTNSGSTWTLVNNGSPYSGATTLSMTISPTAIGLNSNQYRLTGYKCNPAQSTNSTAATLTVEDNTAPVVTCPSTRTLNLDGSCSASLPNYISLASATDACNPSLTIFQAPLPGLAYSSPGARTITMTSSDGNGNSGNCTFTVNVNDVTGPSITCPGAQPVTMDGSCDGVLGNYTASFFSNVDGCDPSPVVTQSPAIGSTISGAGPTTVTLTSTDASSNTGTCTFSVNHIDNTNPTITCPGTQNFNLNASCAGTLPDYTGSGTPADNCDVSPSVSQSPSVGFSLSGTGTVIVTLTATDASANVSTGCSFTVNKVDGTGPSISCPGSQMIYMDGSCNGTLSNYTSLPTTSDNCDPSPSISQSPTAGSTVNGTGSETVTMTSTDATGNTSTCTISVVKTDTLKPTITCPGNQTFNLDASCSGLLPDYTGLASTSDNCDPSPAIGQIPAIGSSIPGITSQTVQLRPTDSDGNTGTGCSFTVSYLDVTAPALICPGNQTVYLDANCDIFLPDYRGMSTTNDNCDVSPVKTQSPLVGQPISGIGATTVTITSTDASTNFNTCSFTVTRADSLSPLITCPGTQTINLDASCQESLPDYRGMAVSSDNCDPSPALTQSPSAGTTISTVGSQTIAITTTDATGNNRACAFTLNRLDVTVPTITCPSTQTIPLDGSCKIFLADYRGSGVVNDNCDPSPVVTQSPSSATTITGIGSTTVTLTGTDVSTNASVPCTFTVNRVDTTGPSISCPGSQTVYLDANCQSILDDYTGQVTVSDNCDGSPFATQSPFPSTVVSTVSTLTVVLTSNDATGNNRSCSISVSLLDTLDPTLTCPGLQSLSLDANCQAVMPDYTAAGSVLDNCDASPTVTQSPAIGSTVSGTTNSTVTLTASDASGNTSPSCSFSVTPQDLTGPNITCPSAQSVNLDGSCNGTLVNYTGLATVVDNCDVNPVVTQNPAQGTAVSGIGTSTVTIIGTDATGNFQTCALTINKVDVMVPTVTCPSTQTVYVDANCDAVLADYTGMGTSADNCDPSPVISQSPAIGSTISGVGNSSISLTATDASGNPSTSCTFSVTKLDTLSPTVSCPGTQTLSMDGNCQSNLPNYTSLGTAVDNCDVSPSILQSPSVGMQISGSGSLTITLFGQDASGNSSGGCTFTVDKVDSNNPTVTCPANQTVSLDANCQYILADFSSQLTTSDNCDTSLVVTQSPVVATLITGHGQVVSVSMTVTDDYNNTDVCTFNVTTVDNTAPTAVCVNIPAYIDGSAQVTVNLNGVDGGSFDNCSIQSITVTGQTQFNCSQVGPSPATLTIVDGQGLLDSCIATVNVQDTLPPIAICNPISVVLDSITAQAVILPPDIENGSIDNCGIGSLSVSQSIFTCLDIGINQVQLFVTDVNGNVTSCNSAVTVSDPYEAGGAKPIVTQSSGTLSSSSGVAYQWALNGNAILGATSQTYVPTLSGSYTVTVTYASGCSNTSDPLNVTVGLESALSVGIRIYPNPNQGIFNISSDEPILGTVRIGVTDIAGQKIFERNLLELRNPVRLDLGDLPKGIYLIELETEMGKYVQKLLLE